MFTLTGVLTKIKSTEKVSEKFQKREIVCTDTSAQFPNPIPMQFTQERCKLLDSFKEGEEVEIKFYLRGNTVEAKEGQEEKTFCNIEGFTIKRVEA